MSKLYVLRMSQEDAHATDYLKPYLMWLKVSKSQTAKKELKAFNEEHPKIEYHVDCYEFSTLRDAGSAQQLALRIYDDVDLSWAMFFMTEEDLRMYCQENHLELVY